jgi:phage repressor protein C with HTH and peptisase S24 domain
VDRSASARRARAGIYVLRLDGVLLVKRLTAEKGRLVIASDNPAFPEAIDLASSRAAIVGRVLWTGRRLV